MKNKLLSAALILSTLVPSAFAQQNNEFHRRMNLAMAQATGETKAGQSADGAVDEKAQAAELAKKLQNPVASLISVPIQNNWDFGIGPENAMRYTVNVQPVIPFSISEHWNLITRTITPIIYAESPVKGGDDKFGLGDIVQSFFFSPKEPVGGWILAAGPVALWPTATDSTLGAGKWGAGPTILVLQQKSGWTYGLLANHIWSYGGWGDQQVNVSFVQPILSYTTKKQTTLRPQHRVHLRLGQQRVDRAGEPASQSVGQDWQATCSVHGWRSRLRGRAERRARVGIALRRHLPFPEVNHELKYEEETYFDRVECSHARHG